MEYHCPMCGSSSAAPKRLARLADVPLQTRIDALRRLLNDGELTEEEIPLALLAVINPGDLSTRLAA